LHSDILTAMASHSKPSTKSRTPVWVWIVLAAPYAGLLFPQIYARATPTLFGFPFFYWYQMAWVVATSLLLSLVYRQHGSR
jgi:predicted membrane-bound dolichyl-phosphate-mannose-protein mannosyltransferase